ncbi:hypothetical protein SOV_04580 [Sporomusa ovata DSM 2662]|nr:DNL zinc finger protein [Sporomusa ovata DSM 2662]
MIMITCPKCNKNQLKILFPKTDYYQGATVFKCPHCTYLEIAWDAKLRQLLNNSLSKHN